MGRPGVGQGRLRRRLAAHWHPRRPGDPHRHHTLDTCPAASQPALFPCSHEGSSRSGGEPATFPLADSWPGEAPESPCHCRNYSLEEAVGLSTHSQLTLGSAPGRRGSAADVVPAWDRQSGDRLALPRWGGGVRPSWRPDWHLLCPVPAGQLHCPGNRNLLPLPVNMTHPGGRSSIPSTFSEPHFLQAPMATWPLPQGAHRP